ncbi:unnamed protein product [Caenorhabditis brenneri]
MKILKLPFLAIAEIFKEMGFGEILKLSTCSSRIYHIIRYVKLDEIGVLLQVAAEKSSVWSDKWNNLDKIVHLETLDKFEEGSTTMKIKMGGADFECTWTENQLRIASQSHIENTIVIFHHVLNLIKFSEKIQLDLLLDSKEVDNFPIFEGVTATALRGESIDTNTVETFCLKYPSQKSMVLIPKLTSGLSPISPILKVEEICFHGSEETISLFLESFSGRIAFFRQAKCPVTSIVTFMRNWMTGSSHQSLEFLRVTFDIGFLINSRMIYDEFETETKNWDPTLRPGNYEFDSKTIGIEDVPKTIDCSYFLDIERHKDGKLASFLVLPFQFQFYVWNIN